MPHFSESSKEKLATCHYDLQRLFNEVIKHVDCKIICGERGREEQTKAFEDGKSKVQYPNGKHNKRPSEAVDCIPYPIDWKGINRLYMFVGYVRGVANSMGIKIRCGADWDGDFEVKDQTFDDLPHFELVKTK
jgi:peptidoglycan LD-endopeptidase CwlK